MPYDPSLDAATFKETKDFGETRVTVGVFSYNGGVKKLQISRENVDPNGDWKFAKLGRMTKPEAQEVVPILMKAIENM